MPTHVPAFKSAQLICNISILISRINFMHLTSKPDHEDYSMFLRVIKLALKPRAKRDPATALPEAYKKASKVFG